MKTKYSMRKHIDLISEGSSSVNREHFLSMGATAFYRNKKYSDNPYRGTDKTKESEAWSEGFNGARAGKMRREELGEDTIPRKIVKGTWTDWQDRDGIYLVHPGNSCYAGFSSQEEAEKLAAALGGQWRVLRHGRYKDMTDDEAMDDYDLREKRLMSGFYNKPIVYTEDMEVDDDGEDPISDAHYAHVLKLEKAIRMFCEKELSLSFSRNYAVNHDDEGIVAITPDEEEITYEQLTKLRVIGSEIRVMGSQGYGIRIELKVHKGLSISKA